MSDESYKFVGIYRCRSEAPGFGIVVFSKDGLYYVSSHSDPRTKVHCEVPDANIRDYQGDVAEILKIDASGEYVYAFELPSRELLVGTKESLKAQLRPHAENMWENPFILSEVARFLGDQKLEARAMEKCNLLLKRHDKE